MQIREREVLGIRLGMRFITIFASHLYLKLAPEQTGDNLCVLCIVVRRKLRSVWASFQWKWPQFTRQRGEMLHPF